MENGKKRALRRRERLAPKRGGRPRLLTDEQVRAAYVVYTAGHSIRAVAKMLMDAGHRGTLSGLESALFYGFRRLGLDKRSNGEAARIWHRAKGHKPKHKSRKCGKPNRAGKPCRQWATPGTDSCYAHR